MQTRALDTALPFHELSFVAEGEDVVVGRLDIGSYAVLPRDGAELLQQLCDGVAPSTAAQWYAARFHEDVDIDEFLESLHDLGFVRAAAESASSRPVHQQWAGRLAFSFPALVLYCALVAGGIVEMTARRDLVPSPHQIFFADSLLIVQLVITFGQIPLLFAHEGCHILAGKRLGLPTRLSISNRLMYVVFETQMNGVLSVARGKRYLPFLAGMLGDVGVIAVLDVTANLTRTPAGALSITGRVAVALAFTVCMRLAWQFQLFLRTDLYFVAATALNCHDLHDASKAILWSRIWRIIGRPDRVVAEDQWTEHDRRVGSWYGPFLVLGVATLVAITVFASTPIVLRYFDIAIQSVVTGRLDGRFWDGLLSLTINLGQLALLITLARRKKRQLAKRTATAS
ncbi:MAG: hypothetical protein JWN95_3948 [Frankiales bacterium]|nr:hypothetical protein [Frankiales bacterium]